MKPRSDQGAAVRRLAESIADGQSVEWDSVGGSEADRMLRQLKRIAAVTRAHRARAGQLDAQPSSPATSEVPRLATDILLAGRYLVVRPLGAGGMGEVYEAIDQELGIRVALKTLRVRHGANSVFRLKREVLLARAVAHGNICRVHDLGRHEDAAGVTWFLTMELLQGPTLRQLVREHGRLAPERALPLIEQVAGGLDAAHDAGIAHRDFKSGNVMLADSESDTRVVITDFGLARALAGEGSEESALIATGAIIGTPAYMAPEQLRRADVGTAADIYALGVVLFELVTGRLPFEGDAGLVRRLLEDPPSPRSIAPELDELWEKVIARCLAREPAARFARAGEVADALAGRSSVARRARQALPAERDSFVGREQELAGLNRKLGDGVPLVTVLGTAGMGKTRLAIRFGWQSLEQWPGGVWFCDLTDAHGVNGLVSSVAGALGVPLGRGDPIEQLGHAIAGRGRCLLILDNFETVVEHAEATVGRWLASAPAARFAVTSRERTNLIGEELLPIEHLEEDAAVELFLERARQQRPGLVLQAPDHDAVRQLVRLLEGLPLALELAASRMRVMTVTQMVRRMRERFSLLRRAGHGRHATLEAAIDGSWELLRPWEQAALAQCAVFESGFNLVAAEAVLDLESSHGTPWVVDVVQSLVDKSLLRAWVPVGTGAAELRFSMYASIQEYARGKLEQAGAIAGGASGPAAARAAEARHSRWYARHGSDEVLDALNGRDGAPRRTALALELDNLMAACRRAIARSDGSTAVANYRAAWAVLEMRGPLGLGLELGHQVLAASLDREDRARAAGTVGRAAQRCGKAIEAVEHYQESLAIWRECGHRRAEGIVLSQFGTVYLEQGRLDDARAQYEAALPIQREVGDRRSEGITLCNLGIVHGQQGRVEEALAHYEAALATCRITSHPQLEGAIAGNLARVHFEQGEFAAARSQYEVALATYREIGDRRLEALTLSNLIGTKLLQGQVEEARVLSESALSMVRELGDRRIEAVLLSHLGQIHRLQASGQRARAYFEAALAVHREVSGPRFQGETLGEIGALLLEEGCLEEARNAIVQAEALVEGVDRVALGKILCSRARLEHATGDSRAARAALARAEELAAEVGAGEASELGLELARARAAVAVRV